VSGLRGSLSYRAADAARLHSKRQITSREYASERAPV